MKTTTTIKLVSMMYLIVLSPNFVGTIFAQNQAAIKDEEIKIVDFEELRYPLAARLAHVEGIVVVRAKLDREGKVIETAAISGAEILIADCLVNAKKWRFKPNPQGAVIIVYDFRIRGLCHGIAASQFSFQPPNLASITSCDAVVEP